MQEIKVGLFKKDFGWERILDQEKVNWDIIKKISKEKYSLIILNDISKKDEIKAYLKEGGAVISDINIKVNSNKNIIKTKFGEINQYRYGKGYLLVLPFKIKSLLNKRTKRRLFPSLFVSPDELGPFVNKSELRELIVKCLIYLHNIRNIPYVHLWYYPFGYKNIFCFRLDVDRENLKEIRNFYDLSRKYKIDFSWYINCKICKNILPKLKYLFKQDVQSHGYIHDVFNSFEENYKNLRLADKILNKKIKGFVAPFGKWNYSLDKTLNKLNYEYSSEFALDYNSFPFYPIIKDNKSNVLQIPIHPICIGSLVARLYSERKMKLYFEDILVKLHQRRLPLLLYGHPVKTEGKYISVIEHILKIIKNSNVLCIPLTGFANWWRYRNKIKFKVIYEKGKLKVTGNNKKIGLRIISKDKEKVIRLKKQDYKIKLKDFDTVYEENWEFTRFDRIKLLITRVLFYFKRVFNKFF